MSELNTFSLSVIMGRAISEIGEFISSACGSLLRYQPKNPYITTPERDRLLKSLYARNCTALENKLGLAPSLSLATDTFRHAAQLKAVHTISMFESMSSVESMRFVAETKHSEAWNTVSSFVGSLKEQLRTPEFSIRSLQEATDSCEPLLNHVAQDCHSVLAKAESALVMKTMAESMSSLAYKVKTEGSNLLASKGLFSVRARVENGTVLLDSTAFPGISCHAEVHKIEKELKERGLLVTRLCGYRSNLRDEKTALRNPFPDFSSRKAPVPKDPGVVRPKQRESQSQGQPKQTLNSLLTRLGQRTMNKER
jgi:hypothetical protein